MTAERPGLMRDRTAGALHTAWEVLFHLLVAIATGPTHFGQFLAQIGGSRR